MAARSPFGPRKEGSLDAAGARHRARESDELGLLGGSEEDEEDQASCTPSRWLPWALLGSLCFALCSALGYFVHGLYVHALTFRMLQKDTTFWNGYATCAPATFGVATLRAKAWPSTTRPPVPRISEVIYINLDSDEPRRQFMEAQFVDIRKRGIQVELTRFSAVTKLAVANSATWAAWRDKGWAQTSLPNVSGNLGVAGCALSHYTVLSQLQRRDAQLLANNEVVVISEDDAEFAPDFLDIWAMLWQYTPDDWDLLRIGWYGDHDNCTNRINFHVDRAGWMQPVELDCQYCGTQAYIVRPGHIGRILQRFEVSKITHADTMLSAPTPPLEDMTEVPELNIYATMPMLAYTHRDYRGKEVFRSDRD